MCLLNISFPLIRVILYILATGIYKKGRDRMTYSLYAGKQTITL
jgi:hypothetical protein